MSAARSAAPPASPRFAPTVLPGSALPRGAQGRGRISAGSGVLPAELRRAAESAPRARGRGRSRTRRDGRCACAPRQRRSPWRAWRPGARGPHRPPHDGRDGAGAAPRYPSGELTPRRRGPSSAVRVAPASSSPGRTQGAHLSRGGAATQAGHKGCTRQARHQSLV